MIPKKILHNSHNTTQFNSTTHCRSLPLNSDVCPQSSHFFKLDSVKELYTGTPNSDIRKLCTVHCGRNVNKPMPQQKLKGKD